MPRQSFQLPAGVPRPIRAGFADLIHQQRVTTGFDSAVLVEAEHRAAQVHPVERDRTDLPFQTLDPTGSRDLDQAFFCQRRPGGYTLWYAIADVASFVEPGRLVDREAHRRGQTIYAPTARFPLHPTSLSEGAASLLADGHARPAAVWQIDLDEAGAVTAGRVERALVRNRCQLNYTDCQAQFDQATDTVDEQLVLLREIGQLRQAQEVARGGISLNLPDQEIDVVDGHWHLAYRAVAPIEGWNAQLSLVTGSVAADMMLAGGIGVVRTLPVAQPEAIARLQLIAHSLGLAWPDDQDYPGFVRSLDPSRPSDLAMMTACTTLFRGAGYLAFTEPPEKPTLHGALAMNYAHVTAPLRRLVDRYATEACLALSADQAVPDWATAALAGLPAVMAQSDRRANAFERGVVSLLEALILSSHEGEILPATVVSVSQAGGRVQVADPAVELEITAPDLPLGQVVDIRIVQANLTTGQVAIELA